ncbi:MAG: alpha/beta fold hydrolase [Candidatus Dormibacteria bacterium]
MSMSWKHRRIPLGWGRMCVHLAGDGPPLLLLHGLGGSGRYWAGLAPALAGTHLLIAPDLAGFGRSDKPRIDYSRDFHLDTLDSLLGALRVEVAVGLAGHSMGGILAALLALRRPEAVESLALVAAPFPREQRRPTRMPTGRVRLATYGVIQRLLPIVSPLVRSATFPREVVADYLRHTVASYQSTSHALIWDPAVGDLLGGLDAALGRRRQLLLYSDQDTTIAADSRTRWEAVLPGAELQVMPGAHQLLLRDHFVTLARWFAAEAARPAVAPQP